MPIITTKVLGLGGSEADPKPAIGLNYAGEPMKPGDFYNGRPEHQSPNTPSVSHTHEARTPKGQRKRRISPEHRAALAKRLRDYWAARKAQGT